MFRRTRSYPPELRERARELRRAGFTYTEIIEQLGGDIPQPTVQSWVKDVALTTEQKARIKQKEVDSARRAQPLGALWSRLQSALPKIVKHYSSWQLGSTSGKVPKATISFPLPRVIPGHPYVACFVAPKL